MENIGIVPVDQVPTARDLLFFDRFLSTGALAERPSPHRAPRPHRETIPQEALRPVIDSRTLARSEEAEAAIDFLQRAQLFLGTDDESMESLLRKTDELLAPCPAFREEWERLGEACWQAESNDFSRPYMWRFQRPYQANQRLVSFVSQTRARLLALHRTTETATYTPIVSPNAIPGTVGGRASAVVRVVLKHFPIPCDDVSFQEIVEFRSQDKVARQLQLFRRWMRCSLADESKSPAVVGEELADGLSDFTAYMRTERWKYNTEVVQLLLTFPLATVERLAKLEFSQLLDPLFALEKARIGLHTAETLTAPGRELAYLHSVRSRFTRGSL